MNLKHLGDALDLTKGFLIRLLKSELLNLHVIPMLTDPGRWRPDHFSVYARSLDVNVENILRTSPQFFAQEQRNQNVAPDPQYDLFLDPDVGVKKATSSEHITPSQIKSLVPDGSTRMLLIYQHAGQRVKNQGGTVTKAREYLENAVSLLNSMIGDRCVFAYFAEQTSMIFVSRDIARLNRIREHLEKFLGPIAKDNGVPGRIIG